jgi:hypothetical protein
VVVLEVANSGVVLYRNKLQDKPRGSSTRPKLTYFNGNTHH